MLSFSFFTSLLAFIADFAFFYLLTYNFQKGFYKSKVCVTILQLIEYFPQTAGGTVP